MRNPYELRMECFQMAESRLRDRFLEEKERFQYLDEKSQADDLTYPTFPTDEDIRRVANEMIRDLALIHISDPTRRRGHSYAVIGL